MVVTVFYGPSCKALTEVVGMKNIVFDVLGTLLLTVGTLSLITPIPGGLFMISLGIVLLICSSAAFRYCLQVLRGRSKFVNRIMVFLEKKTGQRIGGILKVTEPQREQS